MLKPDQIIFPQNTSEMSALGWEQPDFILVTGDAFIDHPGYGSAIIARVLQNHGYRIGVISQPDWHDPKDIRALGVPKFGFLVTSGCMDSMVNHYTVNKKKRRSDAFTPGGVIGKRPNRAVITYCALIRQTFGKVPIIIGGIEASLRRFAHYDYWQDKVRRPILFDAQADLLVYGMGEKAIVEIADALSSGLSIQDLVYIRGTAFLSRECPDDAVMLPSFEQVSTDKAAFAKAAQYIQGSNDPYFEKAFVQPVENEYLIQNPAQMPLTEAEMDAVYDLPYSFEQLTPGKTAESFHELKFSITANRGCFGNCSFCALAIHQGRYMQHRSKASIIKEAKKMTALPDFKGYIHDVGGPTANFRSPACEKQKQHGVCRHRECLFPKPCDHIDFDESAYCDILRSLRELPKVKKVFVRSGIRYDYLLRDKNSGLLKQLVKHHISGQLRVAPEHISDTVLKLMGKPAFSVYEQFEQKFYSINRSLGKEQYIVPYFISSHPGTTLQDAIRLSEYFKAHHVIPEQVQDFYPTPGTLSTAMYYTGYDPQTMTKVYIPKGKEKLYQRALLQFNDPKNRDLVEEALHKAGRDDLIGYHKNALIRPKRNFKPSPEKTTIKKKHTR